MSKMESFLTSGVMFKKSLSKIYKLLIESDRVTTNSRLKWERDLQRNILEAEWDQTNKYIMDGLANVAM